MFLHDNFSFVNVKNYLLIFKWRINQVHVQGEQLFIFCLIIPLKLEAQVTIVCCNIKSKRMYLYTLLALKLLLRRKRTRMLQCENRVACAGRD